MKVKIYHLYSECYDEDGGKHVVTVVGRFEQKYVPKEVNQEVPVEIKPGSFVKGKLSFNKRTLHRKLTIGISICHPLDEFDEEFGVELAKARIEKGQDAGTIETNDVTMLTEDAIMAELLTKLTFVTQNIDEYVS